MPSDDHERRRTLLDSLAVLAGCTQSLAALPDSTVPDVLRWRARDGFVVLGEAKATETPGCADTQRRFSRYLEWVSAPCRRRGGMLAICHARADGLAWLELLERITARSSLSIATSDCVYLDDADLLSYVVVPSPTGLLGEAIEPRSSTSDPVALYRRAGWERTAAAISA